MSTHADADANYAWMIRNEFEARPIEVENVILYTVAADRQMCLTYYGYAGYPVVEDVTPE